MATSLGQLLDALAATAQSTHASAAARADAGTAVGQLGRGLSRLHHDGVYQAPGDPRGRLVADLASACMELAARAPATESSLARLAGAAADALGILYRNATHADRWAAVAAVAETITPLAALTASGLPDGPAAEWVAEVERQAALVQQTATLQPPSRADAITLDRPIPGGDMEHWADPAIVVPDTVAILLQATRGPAAPLSIAEVLALATAAETLSRAAERLGPIEDLPPDKTTAADAWRALRSALGRYDDGSRYLHPDAPRSVRAAGRLHAALHHLDPDAATWTEPLRSAVAAAAQHLPTFATQLLHRTVRSWADSGGLLAYAYDLPNREDRIAASLRGDRTGGVVRVEEGDLRPVVGALHNARLLSLVAAVQAAEGADSASDFPRRVWAAHRTQLDQPQTAAALSAARQEAYRQLQAGRRRPPGSRRGR